MLHHKLWSQINLKDSLEKNYLEYFELPREDVFLHLNKTTYLKGEEIWFTGYVQDRFSGLPSFNSTTLYVFLYNANNQLMDKKVLYVKDGITKGQFRLSNDYNSGTYFVKAYTNWMRNFKQEYFLQQIQIITEDSLTIKNNTSEEKYGVTIHPEAGDFITEASSNFGFRLTDSSGNPIKIRNGVVKDNEGIVILSNITNNNMGIGNFRFLPNDGRNYILQLELPNGDELIKEIPKPSSGPLNLSINNLFKDKVSLSISTNKKELNSITNEKFYVAIHKDGKLAVSSFRMESLQINLQLDKKNLLPGINTLTLFNKQLEPIAERLFFNEYNFNDRLLKLNAVTTFNKGDSLDLNLKIESKLNVSTNMSVSVLPKETKSNSLHSSIVSSFLLNPYLNESVENLNLLLSDMDRKKYYELDQFLIMQDFDQNKWKTIFENPPIATFNFKKGIDVTGKVINAEFKEDNQMVLYPTTLHPMQFSIVERSKDFAFKNLLLEKEDSLSFSLINKKGKSLFPNLEVNFSSFDISDDGLSKTKPSQFSTDRIENMVTIDESEIDFYINENVTYLEETTVYGEEIKERPKQNPGLLNGIFEGVKITEKDVKKNFLLSGFIKSLGFRIAKDAPSNKFYVLPKIAAPGFFPPIVFVNGFQDKEMLNDIPLNSVDEVYYEMQGTHGSNGGTIYIYYRYGSIVGEKEVQSFKRILAEGGFDKPRGFTNPNYVNYTSELFQKFGTIHWQSSVSTTKDGEATITIPNLGTKELKLYIEGMDVNGKLISAVKEISF